MGDFGAIFWKKPWTIVQWFFPKFGVLKKWKIEVGITSNLLHSLSTSICIRKCNKNFGWFRSHFLEKTMDYSTVIFSKIWSIKKVVITWKIEVGISSNLLHSLSTSICIRKCNKNFGWFWSHFLEKTMDYSTVIFSKIWSIKKVVITWKIEVGISSNLLHSLSTSICIRKCNKNFGWFWSHFLEKTMDYSTVIFSKIWSIKKVVITWKIEVGISSNLLHSLSTSICIRKCNKNFGWFWSHFLEKTMDYSTVIFSKIWSIKKVVITWKIEVGITSNLLHSWSTSICIRKCNKNFGWFRSHFLEKTMDYSTVIFSKIWSIKKVVITWKIEVGITSNLLHSLSTSICMRKCNKNALKNFYFLFEKVTLTPLIISTPAYKP